MALEEPFRVGFLQGEQGVGELERIVQPDTAMTERPYFTVEK